MPGLEELWDKARSLMPGGVNSSIRALYAPRPLIAARGRGAYLETVDGERLLDMIMGYGPLILGHAHPRIVEAVRRQAGEGTLYGATTPGEIELAERVLRHVYPGGMIRLVNSGTEATMTAVRLARAYTGRELVVKFAGGYHGANDSLLVSAGSAAGELGVPMSPGVPECLARRVLVAEFNSFEQVEEAFRRHGDDIAAVIVEPVMANSGVIPPKPGFLEHLRRLTREAGSLLIFDEVVTGFRLGLEGARGYYNVEPDLVTLGKIIGGGLPVGAVAGRRSIMEHLTPEGRVFNAGTFNGNPLTVAAGLAAVGVLEEEGLGKASRVMGEIAEALGDALEDLGLPYTVNRVESMATLFFTSGPVENATQAGRADKRLYRMWHAEMRKRGVLVAPSQLEAMFTSLAHGDEEARLFSEAAYEALKTVKKA